MAVLLEQLLPGIRENGLNTNVAVDFSGASSVKLPADISTGYIHVTDNTANALAVGPNGTTNPVLNVDASTASAATGLDVKGAAATGGLALSVLSSGTNESLTIDAKGSGTVTINGTATGIVVLPAGTTIGGSSVAALGVITSSSANALTAGPNGKTNPVFNVNAATISAATGIDIVGAAAAAGVAVSVTSSGTNENLTVDAKGSGTVTLNGTGTGAVVVGHNLTVDAAGVVTILNNGTGAATAGAITLNKLAGVVTSESITTAAGADYTLTVTDSAIAATDIVFASVALGTSTTGTPAVTTVTPGAGSLVIVVQNIHASAAFNGTIKISFMAVKTA